MEKGFTPGPWTPDPQEGPDALKAEIYPFTIRSDEWAIAEIYGDVARIPAEANARLIAAAPELYEAARAACAWLEDNFCGGELRETLRAALTKAGGSNVTG